MKLYAVKPSKAKFSNTFMKNYKNSDQNKRKGENSLLEIISLINIINSMQNYSLVKVKG